jgi:hypothetical protein
VTLNLIVIRTQALVLRREVLLHQPVQKATHAAFPNLAEFLTPAAVNVVNLQRSPIRESADNTLAAIPGDHFLAQFRIGRIRLLADIRRIGLTPVSHVLFSVHADRYWKKCRQGTRGNGPKRPRALSLEEVTVSQTPLHDSNCLL